MWKYILLIIWTCSINVLKYIVKSKWKNNVNAFVINIHVDHDGIEGLMG